jgi:hypothetical protein
VPPTYEGTAEEIEQPNINAFGLADRIGRQNAARAANSGYETVTGDARRNMLNGMDAGSRFPVGPLDLRARTRLPSGLVPPAYEGTTLSPATENGDYAPLIDPARSRFAAGLLERFGLGAARR